MEQSQLPERFRRALEQSDLPFAPALGLHSAFAQLLAEIDHHRAGRKSRGNDQRGHDAPGVAGIEVAGKALLVVVFEEVEHVGSEAVDCLPGGGQAYWHCVRLQHLSI